PGEPHLSTNPQPKVTECARPPLTPPAAGLCAIVSTGVGDAGADSGDAGAAITGGKIIRGTVLGAEELFHRGEILIDAKGSIACVGCDCSTDPGYAAASVVECANGVISPGFVNPHEHLSYANNAPIFHAKLRYGNRTDWQGARGNARLAYASGANQTVQAYAELRYAMGGTTTIAGGGGNTGIIRNVDDGAHELEGLPIVLADSQVFPLGSPNMNLSMGCAYANGRDKATTVSLYESYLPHISEGIDVEAHNEILCSEMGMDTYDLLAPQTAIIHAVATTPSDAMLMRAAQTGVVWSPRSNVDLYGDTASIAMLDMQGVQISLGTDWIPSGSMNMLRELQCADSLNDKYFGKHFTDADLWRMATMNGAFAVGADKAIGMLKKGYLADLAIFDGTTSKDYRAVIDAGVEDVALVLRGGTPLYGDDALVSSAVFGGAACELITPDVCGQQKRACIDVRGSTVQTLATLRTAGEAYYPLFFCKGTPPTNEPSCTPYRTSYPDGITAMDKDGDGIADAADNCADVFNPVRPMDGTAQADLDQD
ncbi:MAG: amidohydrolase family protein, partial [Polyangiaceae bacterium]